MMVQTMGSRTLLQAKLIALLSERKSKRRQKPIPRKSVHKAVQVQEAAEQLVFVAVAEAISV
jgi:hypothetical protein